MKNIKSNIKRMFVIALAVMMMVPNLVMAKNNSFAIYHLKKNVLSMSDQAFDKEKSTVILERGVYKFTLYTKGMEKTIIKTYRADCTKLIFKTEAGEIAATPHETRNPSNDSKQLVPKYFTAEIPAKYLKKASVNGWNEYFHVQFDTNLEAEGPGGAIAKLMMKPEARLYVK